ncbi:PRC-barrel domain-containing protein [Marinovum sp.]|uniref:PRC-barrel domain-containing protein n=1 Tax=Marinovum sp. TaxID=2024839 RepID=UPI002B274581|nr:PRC-barrel domain-containing protein [Marinovum sp.]
MKRLLISTALVAAASGAVVAQENDGMFRAETDPNAIHASDFIGMRVYRAETDSESVEGLQDNWDDIGEIHDIVLTREGEIDSVLVDIGGFLGIGENRVAVDMNSVRFVSDDATAEDDSDFFLVLNAPVSALEEAPAYSGGRMSMDGDAEAEVETDAETTTTTKTVDVETTDADAEMEEAEAEIEGAAEEVEAEVEGAAEEVENAAENVEAEVETEMAEAEAEVEGELAEADAEMEQPETVATETNAEVNAEMADGTQSPVGYGAGLVEREGYANAPLEELTSENLTGAPAYDSNDERIGEVSELILSENGEVKSVIVDVGGFLGIGEKPVELELSQIDILRTDAGGDIRVYIAMTEEELEAMPDYEG